MGDDVAAVAAAIRAAMAPHTDFRGTHESGLAKMIAIGLGKHRDATTLHTLGFGVFGVAGLLAGP
ncbi:hypothetical protein [Saccharopolyspora spinosa]|uniref:hypothetical protein n=1 Tax=Saccharopolyspora spinosa TaxID=60894 RepID=UPI0002379262|nr:hypothetical protein [Saccharopolyspora spinosa]